MATILIVEDEAGIRANLRRFLRLEGHVVVEAENGRRGIEAVVATLPDLILCDLMMPEVDGFGVLRAVRDNPATQHIRFCFLTASAEADTRQLGLDQGADGYLVKPFELAELRTLLRDMLDA